MAAGRKVQAYSQLAVLFYVNLLSAFLGERSAGYTASEGQSQSKLIWCSFVSDGMEYIGSL